MSQRKVLNRVKQKYLQRIIRRLGRLNTRRINLDKVQTYANGAAVIHMSKEKKSVKPLVKNAENAAK